MSLALLALGFSALVWPSPRLGDVRMRGLIDMARLAPPITTLRRRWQFTLPSRAVGLVAGAVAGAGAIVWRGPAVGVAAAIAVALASAGVARAATRRSARTHDRDLSAALRLLRAELDVGSSGHSALLAAAATAGVYRPAFEACAQAARDGDDVVAAISTSGTATPRELLLVAQTWQLADSLGVPIADVLARVDNDVAARRTQARVVASALAGPRSSAVLLAGLPVLGILLGTAMRAHPLRVLFDSVGGQLLLCAGVLLDAAGVLWTNRLITSAERS